MNFWESLVTIIISVLLGFYLGKFKEFRESKQKIYSNVIPLLIKMYYEDKSENLQFHFQDEYNRSIILSWLYSNKKVARKIDEISAVLVKPERGFEVTKKFQNLIIEIRRDIQPFPWQRLSEKDIKHIYTIFEKKN